MMSSPRDQPFAFSNHTIHFTLVRTPYTTENDRYLACDASLIPCVHFAFLGTILGLVSHPLAYISSNHAQDSVASLRQVRPTCNANGRLNSIEAVQNAVSLFPARLHTGSCGTISAAIMGGVLHSSC
jgi:hypothetical protein